MKVKEGTEFTHNGQQYVFIGYDQRLKQTYAQRKNSIEQDTLNGTLVIENERVVLKMNGHEVRAV